MTRDFDDIYLGGKNGPFAAGRLKIAEAGIGWKNTTSGQIITVSATDIHKMHWLRVAREYELKILKSDGNTVRFDGFHKDSFDDLSSIVKSYYQLVLEPKEVSTKGWNWGQVDFSSSGLSFVVGNKSAFEVPMTEVANATLASKNEVMIEFASQDVLGADGKPIKNKNDVLVEMRFYVPGMATAGKVKETDGTTSFKDVTELPDEDAVPKDGTEAGELLVADEELVLGEDGEALSAAAVFCETIKQKTNMGVLQGEAIARFEELLCLTPRARFEIALYSDFLRLRGKSNDFKILYSSIKKLFLLPKPDGQHFMLVIGIDPPIRQGQTRYPYLVFQIEKEDEVEMDLVLEENEIKEKYGNKLVKSYDGPMYEVVSEVLSGLSFKRIIENGTFKGSQDQTGIKASQKANEVILYPLERSFLSIPKPTIQILHAEISAITFSRVSGAGSSNLRTFEMKISTSQGVEHSFSSIAREEFDALEAYCKSKKLRVLSDMNDDNGAAFDLSSSDEDNGGRPSKRSAASANMQMDQDDDDDESDDEDFKSGSDSDVAEEFDEEYSSEGDSDQEGEESAPAGPSSSKIKEKEKPIKKVSSKSNSSGTEPAKKKQKKDPFAPKRPLSSYILFTSEYRPGILAENPNLSIGEIGKKLGEMWKTVSSEVKAKFESLAQKDKQRYEREMEAYRKTNGSTASPIKEKPVQPTGEEGKFKSEEIVDSESD